ncbi:ornithine cyclodeaminase [Demequina sp. TTPB684]|uniref:ornithine cyclodeaminase n=1 Tax=unclassified Demequina TaxID=2620311 RepID=UPI001CF0DDBF|nr:MULTISPECIES: ornithine cyclodeaminase [unclassified Demequina]MCB2413381.1 ornithine cyclodeaminase [Demequina sp. TTPB684]UPU87394.1 ornithine cyclodeaminase [Demequina sp. TMPB413]
MVLYVDAPRMREWIAERGVEPIIIDLVQRMEQAFTRWMDFEREPRIASHSKHGVIELMPTSDGEHYAFKYVNGHPLNPMVGLQTVSGFGVYSDVATGYPLMVAEMNLLTALRTAATSAMAARYLARPDSKVLALIGTGSQSEFQTLAMRAVVGVDSVRIWDVDPAAMDKYERNMAGLGFDVYRAHSAADAVAGADIVTTCTADKTNATVLTNDMVTEGVHLNAIGGDCPGKTELDAAILLRSRIFVEHEPQTRIEGEIQQLPATHPVEALWRVVAGTTPGRTDDAEITVFDSVGFAIEDFVALAYLRDDVDGTRFAGELDLITSPQDPKDLFSLIATPALTRSAR